MSQELNETIFKKLKESIMTMTYQIENINKMDLKKKPIGNPEVEKYNNQIKYIINKAHLCWLKKGSVNLKANK